ncbi:MAG: hypothetical protein U1F98_07200 [Verrucomicrobiota bacterium]
MNVTFDFPGWRLAALCLGACLSMSARAETVTNLEAVDAAGVGVWNGPFPVVITGVLLTDPGEMLDSTPDFIPWNGGAGIFELGGQWQVFVQTVTPGDRGGVECWMGQNYGNLPWEGNEEFSYDNAAWASETNRLGRDAATGHVFRKGDLVTVTANGSLFYGGMQNINEEHSIDPAYDFALSLVSSNYGLPTPEVISLSSVMGTNLSGTGHYDLFDATRATGGEHWQGMRVRINGLTLVTSDGWTTNSDWYARYCVATDGEGRQFPLVHPLYDLGPAPTNRFDVTGVFLQESGSGTDGTFGYELFVQEIAPSDAAVLTLVPLGASVEASWPGSLANYALESADAASGAAWSAVTNSVVVAGGRNTVTLGVDGAARFFRLKRVR